MTVETNEQDKGPEALKRISLTPEENLMLMMADPESAEVKAIMDAHGIEFGDLVEADVDGVKMVVETSKEDFWTRNREATKGLSRSRGDFNQEAANRARGLVEAPTEQALEVSGTSGAEVKEGFREEAAEDLGEVAVDGAEQEPQAGSSQKALEMKAQFDRRVDDLLDQEAVHPIETDLSELEDETYRLAHTLQPTRLKDASEQLRGTIASIENDSYGIEAARTKLTQIEEELATADSLLRAATEAGIQDVKSIAERTRKQITNVSGELQTIQKTYEEVSQDEGVTVGSDADTGKISEELQAISTDFEEFAASLDTDRATLQEHSRMLQVTVNQLSELIRQTYNGRLEASELHTLYATLLGVVNGVSQVSVHRKTVPLIETSKGHLTTIKQQRNWE